MFYWVMTSRGGGIFSVGPYKSREAAENRMQKTNGAGGDIFETFETDPARALDEYKAKLVGRV